MNITLNFDFNVNSLCIYSLGATGVNYDGTYVYMDGAQRLAQSSGYLPWDVTVAGKNVTINKVGGGYDDRPVTLYVMAM